MANVIDDTENVLILTLTLGVIGVAAWAFIKYKSLFGGDASDPSSIVDKVAKAIGLKSADSPSWEFPSVDTSSLKFEGFQEHSIPILDDIVIPDYSNDLGGGWTLAGNRISPPPETPQKGAYGGDITWDEEETGSV